MQEPLFQHIYLHEGQSYNILKVDRPYFVVPWHQHPEIEIMSIVEGEGSRFVGDSIENFEHGDLVVVGSNLPHCWKNNQRHHSSHSSFRAKAQVILFLKNCFGDEFFTIQELKNVNEMLLRAERGIWFTGKTSNQIIDKITEAYKKQGAKRFIAFLEILCELAESTEYKLLASEGYKPLPLTRDLNRLNKVMDYLMLNFNKPLRLEDISSIAYMSPTAFCRYFKSHTNKTVIQFLNEIRIGYAKKLLISDVYNISSVQTLCGFHNTSNFYDQFKKKVGCTPLQFKKRHEKKAMSTARL